MCGLRLHNWLYSHRQDVTLANPLGPAVRGWQQVAATIEHAASQMRDGEIADIENVLKCVTPELAYIVRMERAKAKEGGQEAVTRSGPTLGVHVGWTLNIHGATVTSLSRISLLRNSLLGQVVGRSWCGAALHSFKRGHDHVVHPKPHVVSAKSHVIGGH
jgi:hypothetical protein